MVRSDGRDEQYSRVAGMGRAMAWLANVARGTLNAKSSQELAEMVNDLTTQASKHRNSSRVHGYGHTRHMAADRAADLGGQGKVSEPWRDGLHRHQT